MGSTFKSNDTEMSEILKGIELGANQLPDFQRGWVWDDERICALIASISNSYPVGALMFLEYGEILFDLNIVLLQVHMQTASPIFLYWTGNNG